MKHPQNLAVLAACAAMLGACQGRSSQPVQTPHSASPATKAPLDVAAITSQPKRFHNRLVHVRGIVTSVCQQEGRFIDLAPLSGKGDGVLVSARESAFQFPTDSVGKIATVKGTFYSKIYPFYRMGHWHHHGWRASASTIPSFAKIFRIEADSVSFSKPETMVKIQQRPLVPHTSLWFDLASTEFEAARMGTGKKCLQPGDNTPEHSSRRYHELIFVIEGELTVKIERVANPLRISKGQATYVPPQTRHAVFNRSSRIGCYIFVYSLPEQPPQHEHKPNPSEDSKKHEH